MNFPKTSISQSTNYTNNIKKHVERKKIVIIGDRACGKTTLLQSFTNVHRAAEYVPKVLEHSIIDVQLQDKRIELALWNTAGQENFDCLCNILYSDANIALLCFSFDKPESLKNVVNRWYPELHKICPNIPIILVGNKMDLRQDFQVFKTFRKVKKQSVKSSEGRAVAETIKATCYSECSAKKNVGVKTVFQNVIKAITVPKEEQKRSSRLFLNKI